jgi:UV DNA damage endonuclease
MLRRLGYVAVCLSIDAPTNRTCRLRSATPERLRELIQTNLSNLIEVLEFNARHGILMYRLSSDIIPFASHPINELAWWDEFRDLLDASAALIRRHGMRVSMHPGQYTVLNSTNPEVVEAAIADLAWHTRLLDALDVDQSCKIVLHVGGAVGGKEVAMRRFVDVASQLPEGVLRRLIVENDDRVFDTEDALAVAHDVGIPVVFDWLHHKALPGGSRRRTRITELMSRCFATWRPADGIPKVHMSSQARPGRRGAHAQWVSLTDFRAFLEDAPDHPFDAMLECKAKDLALFRLRRQLARIGIVEPHLAHDPRQAAA